MRRRTTTRAEDLAFVRRRIEDAGRAWQVGDACRPYKGGDEVPDTKVERVEGDIVYLANGESMHRSHMQRPRGDR